MAPAPTPLADGRVLLDYTSPEGPTITHVRGILLANAIGNLRDFGLYGEYVRLLPREHQEVLLHALAASWVPVANAVAHYVACDELPLDDEHFKVAGERQAQRIADTFLGSALRSVRSLGVDTLKQACSRLDRLHGRLNRGGGCTVIDLGRKDLQYEVHGCPFAASQSYCRGWTAYTQSLATLFCKVAYVRLARPREAHPHRLAVTINWV